MRRFLIPILLLLVGLALAAKLVPAEQAAVAARLKDFPDADTAAHQFRPVVVTILCLIPAIAGLFYALGSILARYVARQFLSILAIGFFALATLWLLMDFQDNLDELKDSQSVINTAARLYAARFPEIVVTLLPYALLLSLLFSLGRLSSSREIVAMTQTGRGIGRLTTPFFITGLLCAVLCAGLNYQWAPRANAAEKIILDTARGFDEVAAEVVKFRNPRARRLWMVGSFPPDFQRGAPLKQVRVVLENEDATLKSILVADRASWDSNSGQWSFYGATLRKMSPGEPPEYVQDLPEPYVVRTWRETPAEIIQPGLPANQLGIPGLISWLKGHPAGSQEKRQTYLTQWHHRWAQPFNCLVVVMLATPLGVVFSRRGTTGGIAVTVFLCVGMLFFTTICLSLGDASYLPPMLAAWLPNLAFGALALFLFQRRLSGRPIYQTIRRLTADAP
ncbi:LptF/LptG family permease [Haloferula chungangensis]|uniref:LptF/LptG family permease n=1 Tax=Haloferula chungangensis TaxID=1048331 RepID=A0ABW2L5D6_9BACT